MRQWLDLALVICFAGFIHTEQFDLSFACLCHLLFLQGGRWLQAFYRAGAWEPPICSEGWGGGLKPHEHCKCLVFLRLYWIWGELERGLWWNCVTSKAEWNVKRIKTPFRVRVGSIQNQWKVILPPCRNNTWEKQRRAKLRSNCPVWMNPEVQIVRPCIMSGSRCD